MSYRVCSKKSNERGDKHLPNRILKESICYSDDIDRLTAFEETVFYRLIVNADDFGRMDGRIPLLKSMLFRTKKGITEKNVEDAISKLASVGLVQCYIVDEKPFLQFPKWELHQVVRAKKSKFPAPESNCKQMISNDFKCFRNPIQSNPNTNPNTNPTVCLSIDSPNDVSSISPSIEFYEQNIGPISRTIAEDMQAFMQLGVEEDVIVEAIRRSVNNNKRKWSYTKGILRNLTNQGITTMKEWKRLDSRSNIADCISRGAATVNGDIKLRIPNEC
jgi:DnaD/phage-associated family protein